MSREIAPIVDAFCEHPALRAAWEGLDGYDRLRVEERVAEEARKLAPAAKKADPDPGLFGR